MPGSMEIGVLLGSYNGALSFEQIGSWDVASGAQSSLSTVGSITQTHSSALAGQAQVFSSGLTNRAAYRFSGAETFSRWSVDVTTHHLVAHGWARMSAAGTSGTISAVFSGGSYPIPFHASDVQPFRIEANQVSGDPLSLEFIAAGTTATKTLWADDLLVSCDPVTLYPDWTAEMGRDAMAAGHATLSGRTARYLWSDRQVWTMPLQYVPDSHAGLLNRWWAQGFNLLYTSDTSDTEASFVVRITNETPPFTALQHPYRDRWRGELRLEAVRDGGWF